MIQGEVVMNMGAMAFGVAQTYIVREMVDKNSRYPLIGFLGKYGVASCVAGVALGGAATAVGLIGMSTRHLLNDPTINNVLVSYGVPALVSGALSGYTTPVRVVTPTGTQSFRPSAMAKVAPKAARPHAEFGQMNNAPAAGAGNGGNSGLTAQERVRRGLL